MLPRILFLVFGVVACSTASIIINMCDIHPLMLATLRLLLAAMMLTPFFIRDFRRHRKSYTRKDLVNTIIPGLLLGIHFISWITGIKMTRVANGSLLVNLAPIAMPLFLYFLLREKLSRREWLATALALGGTALLISCDFHLDRQFFIGDVTCFASMLFSCLYLALSRKYRDVSSVFLYVVPLYYIAGIFCLTSALVWGLTRDPNALPRLYAGREWFWVLCLAIFPTAIGHSILNYAMKKLRGQVVSIINMGQFIFAGLMAYLFLDQAPGWSLYIAAVAVVSAALIVVAARKPKAPLEQAAQD